MKNKEIISENTMKDINLLTEAFKKTSEIPQITFTIPIVIDETKTTTFIKIKRKDK